MKESLKNDDANLVNIHDDVDDVVFPEHVCVHCGSPCTALYRQLGTSISSIKAVSCQVCGNRAVDPYIEREWLLIAIDVLLIRTEAYRHVLWNTNEFRTTVTWQRAVQMTFASSLLNAYLKWETVRGRQDDPSSQQQHFLTDDSSSTIYVALLIISSMLDVIVEWVVIYSYLTILSTLEKRNRTQQQNNNVGTKVFWAILLPTTFQVVVVFVLIWENSKTTRALGTILIAGWQGLAIALVSQSTSMTDKRTNSITAIHVIAPLAGMVALVVWRFGMSLLLLNFQYPLPCVGIEVDVFAASEDELNRHHSMTLLPPLLCLI